MREFRRRTQPHIHLRPRARGMETAALCLGIRFGIGMPLAPDGTAWTRAIRACMGLTWFSPIPPAWKPLRESNVLPSSYIITICDSNYCNFCIQKNAWITQAPRPHSISAPCHRHAYRGNITGNDPETPDSASGRACHFTFHPETGVQPRILKRLPIHLQPRLENPPI